MAPLDDHSRFGPNGGDEHVVLVAFDVVAPGRREALLALLEILDLRHRDGFGAGGRVARGAVQAWWMAEDIRVDRSDCDSAVFCVKGRQCETTALLRAEGLAY